MTDPTDEDSISQISTESRWDETTRVSASIDHGHTSVETRDEGRDMDRLSYISHGTASITLWEGSTASPDTAVTITNETKVAPSLPSKNTIQLPGPRALRRSRFRFAVATLDIVLILITYALIAFGILVLFHDGELNDSSVSFGPRLILAAEYGPTIFPIVFAAIIGRMLKALATLQMERGSTVGRIEQLFSSSTIISAIVTQFQLRMLDKVGVLLLVLWAFSPVGSQAAFRLVYAQAAFKNSTGDVTHLNPSVDYFKTFNKTLLTGKSAFTSAMQFAALPRSNQTQDLWGNLRIPMIETMSETIDTNWTTISNSSDVVYSSLAGVPFKLSDDVGIATFVLDMSYLSLTCFVFRQEDSLTWTGFNTSDVRLNKAPGLPEGYSSWAHHTIAHDGTSSDLTGENGNHLAQIAASMCSEVCKGPGCYESCPTGDNKDARKLVWESSETLSQYGKRAKSYAECDLGTTHVDVEYSCAGLSCESKRVRLSAEQNPNETIFDSPPRILPDSESPNYESVLGSAIDFFLADLTSLFDWPASVQSPMIPTVAYLMSPNQALTWMYNNGEHDLMTTGKQQFETRMAQLMNTLHTIQTSPAMVVGTAQVRNESEGPDGSQETFRGIRTVREPANILVESQVVRCDTAWLMVYMGACFILLCASLLTLATRSIILAPDILGSLTMTTLENRCAGAAQGGSTLDGTDRARRLRDLPMRICDVNPAGDSGRIAVTTENTADPAAGLLWGRQYE